MSKPHQWRYKPIPFAALMVAAQFLGQLVSQHTSRFAGASSDGGARLLKDYLYCGAVLVVAAAWAADHHIMRAELTRLWGLYVDAKHDSRRLIELQKETHDWPEWAWQAYWQVKEDGK